MRHYLEPLIFAESDKFLAGSIPDLDGYFHISEVEHALTLFNEQNLPKDFLVWQDFWELYTRYIYQHPQFKSALQTIAEELKALTPNSEKLAIQKRLAYLKAKKQGTIKNQKWLDFKEAISDDLYEILQIISIHRYLFEKPDPILEEILAIIKQGLFPCGIKADKKTIVIYNPKNLTNL